VSYLDAEPVLLGRLHDALRLEGQGNATDRFVLFSCPVGRLERLWQAGVFIKVLARSAQAALELAALPQGEAGIAFLFITRPRTAAPL